MPLISKFLVDNSTEFFFCARVLCKYQLITEFVVQRDLIILECALLPEDNLPKNYRSSQMRRRRLDKKFDFFLQVNCRQQHRVTYAIKITKHKIQVVREIHRYIIFYKHAINA